MKRMFCKPGLCFLALLIGIKALAIDASVSHSIFFGPDNSAGGKIMPNIALSWQVNPHSIHFKTQEDKTIVAAVRTDIYIYADGRALKEDHFILRTPPRTNPDDLATINILDQRRYFVTPGRIKIHVKLTDMDDTAKPYIYNDSFTVSAAGSSPYYSDIQLLDTAFTSNDNTRFTNNGKQLIPMCANFLDESETNLHYYVELYGTHKMQASDLPLIQKVNIGKKENGAAVAGYETIDTISPQPTTYITGSFPLAALGSGNYYVNITLENRSHIILATKSIFFQRLNTHPVQKEVEVKKEIVPDTGMESVTYLNLDKTFVAKYDMAKIRAILKMLIPVSDPLGVATINNFLKKPDEMYMRYFIYNYFKGVNPEDPAKAWKEFTTKILEVNKKFNFQNKPGYETERGAIYLRYGAPTDVITVNNETGTLPYEIWQYNVLNQTNGKSLANAFFLFYKPNQLMGDYMLLHSSVPTEMINMGWRTYLYTNGNTGVNTSTRAEDYIGNR